MLKGRLGRVGRMGWFLAGAATAIVALALAGVAMAALGSPPQQQPPTPTPIGPETYPPGTHLPPDLAPPPTPVSSPRPEYIQRVPEGPGTAGTQFSITVLTEQGWGSKIIQLPPNVYIADRWAFVLCAKGRRCAPAPGLRLALLDGDSSITVSGRGRQIWNPRIAPGEEGLFDWLYQALGVAKGSETLSGPINP